MEKDKEELLQVQLLQLFEVAKKDKKKFRELKALAVSLNQFMLACDLRDIEKELYPESEEAKSAKKEAEKLNLVFRMVELNIPSEIAWLVNQTLKRYSKRKGNFDLKDAAELIAKKNQLFE